MLGQMSEISDFAGPFGDAITVRRGRNLSGEIYLRYALGSALANIGRDAGWDTLTKNAESNEIIIPFFVVHEILEQISKKSQDQLDEEIVRKYRENVFSLEEILDQDFLIQRQLVSLDPGSNIFLAATDSRLSKHNKDIAHQGIVNLLIKRLNLINFREKASSHLFYTRKNKRLKFVRPVIVDNKERGKKYLDKFCLNSSQALHCIMFFNMFHPFNGSNRKNAYSEHMVPAVLDSPNPLNLLYNLYMPINRHSLEDPLPHTKHIREKFNRHDDYRKREELEELLMSKGDKKLELEHVSWELEDFISMHLNSKWLEFRPDDDLRKRRVWKVHSKIVMFMVENHISRSQPIVHRSELRQFAVRGSRLHKPNSVGRYNALSPRDQISNPRLTQVIQELLALEVIQEVENLAYRLDSKMLKSMESKVSTAAENSKAITTRLDEIENKMAEWASRLPL